MKNKILIFIIGFLVGAIVSTSGFCIYNKLNKKEYIMEKDRPQIMQERPDDMPEGEIPEGELEENQNGNKQRQKQSKGKSENTTESVENSKNENSI